MPGKTRTNRAEAKSNQDPDDRQPGHQFQLQWRQLAEGGREVERINKAVSKIT